MLDFEGARDIARKFIEAKEVNRLRDVRLVLYEKNVIDTGYGWVFYYDNAYYLETGIISHALAGNAPFLVLKDGGRIHEFRSGEPLESQLKRFEETHGALRE